MSVATRTVMNSPLSRKHVLIITDGMNTAGPTPAVVMPKLKQQAQEKDAIGVRSLRGVRRGRQGL